MHNQYPQRARSRLRYKLADGERGADHVGVLDGSGQRRLAQGLCQAGDAAVMRHNLYSHQRTPPPPCPTKDHRQSTIIQVGRMASNWRKWGPDLTAVTLAQPFRFRHCLAGCHSHNHSLSHLQVCKSSFHRKNQNICKQLITRHVRRPQRLPYISFTNTTHIRRQLHEDGVGKVEGAPLYTLPKEPLPSSSPSSRPSIVARCLSRTNVVM